MGTGSFHKAPRACPRFHDLYRCLFSRKVFNAYLRDIGGFKFVDVERSLRNISGGERYRCVKANLSKHVRPKPSHQRQPSPARSLAAGG